MNQQSTNQVNTVITYGSLNATQLSSLWANIQSNITTTFYYNFLYKSNSFALSFINVLLNELESYTYNVKLNWPLIDQNISIWTNLFESIIQVRFSKFFNRAWDILIKKLYYLTIVNTNNTITLSSFQALAETENSSENDNEGNVSTQSGNPQWVTNGNWISTINLTNEGANSTVNDSFVMEANRFLRQFAKTNDITRINPLDLVSKIDLSTEIDFYKEFEIILKNLFYNKNYLPFNANEGWTEPWY